MIPSDIEGAAARFAAMPAEAAETELDRLTAAAIGRWRCDEATYWQRVRYRARLLRARARFATLA